MLCVYEMKTSGLISRNGVGEYVQGSEAIDLIMNERSKTLIGVIEGWECIWK